MHKILIIDDDKLIRWSMQELLRRDGFTVATAADPKEALALLASKYFHLVIAEIEFSEGRGVEMLHKIRTLSPESAVIILSALNHEQVEKMIPGNDFGPILTKPYDSDKLQAVVKSSLELVNKSKYSNKFNKEV